MEAFFEAIILPIQVILWGNIVMIPTGIILKTICAVKGCKSGKVD